VSDQETRCGFVALIGAPNAGKSTLLNTIVGAKVSIVSRKVQTTRTLVRGIAIEQATQIIFIDTPGIFAPKRRLDRAMVTSAWGGAGDADVVALLVDAKKGLDEEVESILDRLKDAPRRKVLVLNRSTHPARKPAGAGAGGERALRLPGDLHGLCGERRRHRQVSHLSCRRDEAGAVALPGRPGFGRARCAPLAAEITREKVFERLHDELPYEATVETDSWKTMPDGSARIEQTIFVARDGQKKIVIGEAAR